MAIGANWKGPVKRFKLTVNKPGPQVLVSLCMDGLTKVSPNLFDVDKTDFAPRAPSTFSLSRWSHPMSAVKMEAHLE